MLLKHQGEMKESSKMLHSSLFKRETEYNCYSKGRLNITVGLLHAQMALKEINVNVYEGKYRAEYRIGLD